MADRNKAMVRPILGFGVEIEFVSQSLDKRIPDHERRMLYYRKRLVDALQSGGQQAKPGERKSDADYSMWFITRDGSLQYEHRFDVGIEAVSPVYNSRDAWEKKINDFWKALEKSGIKVKRNHSCGSHVHVAPFRKWYCSTRLRPPRYNEGQLKDIAYAVASQEYLVSHILPPERLNNRYCQFNSRCVQERWLDYGVNWDFHQHQRKMLREQIFYARDEDQLCHLMQGESRYVVWNFMNIRIPGSGTVEFRGGRHLEGEKRTKRWVAFALVFIALAIEMECLYRDEYTSDIESWWYAMKEQAKLLDFAEHLPDRWQDMREDRSLWRSSRQGRFGQGLRRVGSTRSLRNPRLGNRPLGTGPLAPPWPRPERNFRDRWNSSKFNKSDFVAMGALMTVGTLGLRYLTGL
ncbi:hypothetical protein ACLMJK_006858 [Lecanora helva]